jgi:excisionase family DNA binding protein
VVWRRVVGELTDPIPSRRHDSPAPTPQRAGLLDSDGIRHPRRAVLTLICVVSVPAEVPVREEAAVPSHAKSCQPSTLSTTAICLDSRLFGRFGQSGSPETWCRQFDSAPDHKPGFRLVARVTSPNSALWVAFVYGLAGGSRAKSVPTRLWIDRLVGVEPGVRWAGEPAGTCARHGDSTSTAALGRLPSALPAQPCLLRGHLPDTQAGGGSRAVAAGCRAGWSADAAGAKDVTGAPAPAASRPAPPPDVVRVTSAAAAQAIDTILADLPKDDAGPMPTSDEVMTTGQAAVLLGVSRPTMVSWLEAGRISVEWRGTHRRVRAIRRPRLRRSAPAAGRQTAGLALA